MLECDGVRDGEGGVWGIGRLGMLIIGARRVSCCTKDFM